MSSVFKPTADIQVHFRLDFFMKNPGPYCLPYKLPKNINRQEQQMTKATTGGLRVKIIRQIGPYRYMLGKYSRTSLNVKMILLFYT